MEHPTEEFPEMGNTVRWITEDPVERGQAHTRAIGDRQQSVDLVAGSPNAIGTCNRSLRYSAHGGRFPAKWLSLIVACDALDAPQFRCPPTQVT